MRCPHQMGFERGSTTVYDLGVPKARSCDGAKMTTLISDRVWWTKKPRRRVNITSNASQIRDGGALRSRHLAHCGSEWTEKIHASSVLHIAPCRQARSTRHWRLSKFCRTGGEKRCFGERGENQWRKMVGLISKKLLRRSSKKKTFDHP